MLTTRLYSLGSLMTAMALGTTPANAAVKIPTRLTCGPLSHNSRTALMLSVDHRQLSGQRTTSRRPGREV